MIKLYYDEENIMKIAFRIDISEDIGTGHFIRMSALAEAFADFGHTNKFFKGEDEPVDYREFDIIILDTYQVSDEYIAGLNAHGRTLVCYDDNALYTYNCDILINANIYAQELEFKLAGKSPTMLIGGNYALLRREFRENEPIIARQHANHVFVCFGGSDLRNMTASVVDALQRIDDIQLSVVLGEYTNCDEDVNDIAEENTAVFKTPISICQIMSSCDIAVTSSGSIIYELAAIGLPAIIVPQVDNQFLVAEYMLRNELMKCTGNWENIDFGCLKNEVTLLLGDYDRRKLESIRLQKVVDKNGAINAARKIISLHLSNNR